MAISGNLSDFPLPEILLLIGRRTGRLRLFNAEEYLPMELDLSEGCAHGLHLNGNVIVEPPQIVAELAYAIETGEGTFEFTPQPVETVARLHPLALTDLALQVVMYVDESQAKHRAVLDPELFYVLVPSRPAGDLRGELKRFFQQSRHLLSGGVRSEDLAEYLGVDEAMARLQLFHLHQLGLVRLVETTDAEDLRRSLIEGDLAEELADDAARISPAPGANKHPLLRTHR
jgi:hypothetical protein